MKTKPNWIWIRLVVSTLISVPALATTQPMPPEVAAAGFSSADWQDLGQGGVAAHVTTASAPDGSSTVRGYAGIIVPASWSDCLETLYEYLPLQRYIPEAKKLEVLSREPDRIRAYTQTGILFLTFDSTIWVQFDRESRTAKWTQDPTGKNSIRDTTGQWRFVPLEDGRTFVRYETFIDSGMSLPQFVQKFVIGRSLPTMLNGLRSAALNRRDGTR
jgi:hypothetical protein